MGLKAQNQGLLCRQQPFPSANRQQYPKISEQEYLLGELLSANMSKYSISPLGESIFARVPS